MTADYFWHSYFGISSQPQNDFSIGPGWTRYHFMPATIQQNHWVFTLNNPTDEPEELYAALGARYLVVQLERGETGTDHYQGYVEFASRKTLAACKRLLPRAHWEPRRGSREAARAYSQKEDTRVRGPYEFGEWIGGPGARSDISALQEATQAGATDVQLWENHFAAMLRNYRGIRDYRTCVAPGRLASVDPEAIVYYGPTGMGKSRKVMELAPDAYWVSNPGSGQPVWFDGYVGQLTVVFDDFYGWLPYAQLLRIIDRYPYSFNCKGYTVPASATRFFFTSNVEPERWYTAQHHPYGPLERRLTAIHAVMEPLY